MGDRDPPGEIDPVINNRSPPTDKPGGRRKENNRRQTVDEKKRPDNPAKAFLRRYRALTARQVSLQMAIDAAYERAYSRTARLKAVNVQGGGVYDRMAEDVAQITDATEQLKAAKAKVDAALSEILRAIDAVPDEMQRTVLTLRYVEGLDWISVQERIHYEPSQMFVIHGRALWAVKRWLQRAEENGV